ncbi:MAG TPA: hypothetical protein VGO00_08185 [Kofleriaceae bacterium]|jgi:hypothetical protein|nr:hypothetical protein [Kofleriaceae bacterium]
MRLAALVVVLVACSSKNEQHDDLVLFCSPEAAAKATSLADLGGFLEPKLHDTELKKSFLAVKQNSISIDELRAQVTVQLANEQITPCPTLAMFEPHR